MRQLIKFEIDVRDEGYLLRLHDDGGGTTELSASPEQLDAMIDALDELLSEDDEDFLDLEDDRARH